MPNIILVLMFISPIFYPISLYPEIIANVLLYNPIYIYTDFYREVFINNKMPDLMRILSFSFISLILFIIGFIKVEKFKSIILSRIWLIKY